jgi:hypothetical protein
MLLLWGVALKQTHTMGVYGNYEREKRETRTTKEVWTYGTEGLKKLIEYTKKIGLFHGICTRTMCGRSRINHKKLKREEYKWTRMFMKKEKERKDK